MTNGGYCINTFTFKNQLPTLINMSEIFYLKRKENCATIDTFFFTSVYQEQINNINNFQAFTSNNNLVSKF